MQCKDATRFNQNGKVLIAFYNIDNLFDTINDPNTIDDEFTPNGKYLWNSKRYLSKISQLSKVIREMDSKNAPDILGVCELENAAALVDLTIACDPDKSYSIVHFDSEDERGIDVALLYNKNIFKVLESESVRVSLSNDSTDKTRAILWVKMLSINSNDTLQCIVCHFPTRREGQVKSEQNRIDAASACASIIGRKCNPMKQNLIAMGDFNDEPMNTSVFEILGAKDPKADKNASLLNLMFSFQSSNTGSYCYKGDWNLLDQCIISNALMDSEEASYVPNSVQIKSEEWMVQKGKYKGYPLRTFAGEKWLNGYSDHFPVYFHIQLSSNGKKKG